jgi:hypothetical protein
MPERFPLELGTGLGLAVDIAITCTFWTAVQILFFQYPNLEPYKLDRKKYLDVRNRMVSFVHGLSALALSAY